jgi:signal transduction histidine kinase/ligand-binding sensor domain-containing protein
VRTGSRVARGWLRVIPLAALVLAGPVAAEQLIVQSYTVVDGLASNRVACFATDQDGFLWVCTSGGLSRFDGTRFVTYGIVHGLPDHAVNHFLQTRSGSRWVATNGGGVARLEPDVPDAEGRIFTAFAVGRSPRNMRVNVLFETPDGALLAGTDGGLFRAPYPDAEPRFDLVRLALPGYPDAALQVWGMAEAGPGRTWVGTSGGLVLLEGDRVVAHVPIAPDQGADHVYDIVTDHRGRLWLGHDHGLFVWNAPAGIGEVRGGWAPLAGTSPPCTRVAGDSEAGAGTGAAAGAGPPLLPDKPGAVCHWAPGGERRGQSMVRLLAHGDDGWIWMASQAGLGAYDGRRLRLFDGSHGLPTSRLMRVSVDRGGDVWIGSSYGIHRVYRRGFTHHTAQDALVGDQFQTIQLGRDGRVYAVSRSSVIHRLDGEDWTAVRPRLPSSAGGVGRSIYGAALLDREGAWWMGTGHGLVRFPVVDRLEDLAGTPPTAHYTRADGLAGEDIWHLFEDSRGDLWIATRIPGAEPLTRWRRDTGRFQRFGAADGLPPERAVRRFLEHPAGTLWASLWDGGLVRFDGERFQYFAPDTAVPPGHLYGLMVDGRGWLWVAGRETFFTREPEAANPRFEVFQGSDGQPVVAFGLAVDEGGWIYAQTHRGLVRFKPEAGHLQQLGFGHPFAGISTPPVRDPDGTIWYLTGTGVLRYEPRDDRSGHSPPVRISGVQVAGVPLPVPSMGAVTLAPLRLAPGHRQVQFDYFGLAFGADGPVRFQVRLEGLDRNWSPPTTQPTVLYAGLGPGRYRFQVRAVSPTGAVSAEPATVAFVIPPPVWRRDWFLAAVAVLLTGLLVTAHRLRVRRLLELERIRTRIAADLHDDLGASLARVSLLSEATRRTLRDAPERAERLLEEIGATSRDLVGAAGDIAFSIDPGRASFDGLVARIRRFAEDLLAGTDIEWRFQVEGGPSGVVLSSEQRRHLLAIVKESLHNATRHGEPSLVSLTLTVGDDLIEARLMDDGRGFELDAVGNGGGAPGGVGLRSMRQRARELGAVLEIASRPGAGTRVTLRCPLSHAPRTTMR